MSKPQHTEYTIVVSAQERRLLIEALNKLLEIEAESLQVPPMSYNETLIGRPPALQSEVVLPVAQFSWRQQKR